LDLDELHTHTRSVAIVAPTGTRVCGDRGIAGAIVCARGAITIVATGRR
jgi:hypothetical protein